MNLKQVRNQNGMCPNDNYIRAAHRFLAEVHHLTPWLQFLDVDPLKIHCEVTHYVIPGCVFDIGEYSFWLGVNGKRITFVSNLDLDHKAALQVFYPAIIQYTHGWKLACYPKFDGTQMRCVIEADGDLVIPHKPAGMTYGETPMQMTDEGNFYAHEVAQLIQCFILVMESKNLMCGDMPPSNI